MALVAVGSGLLAVCLAYVVFRPASLPSPRAAAGEPGVLVLRLAPGAAQPSKLKTAVVELAPLTLLEPVSGHVVLNENVTARISSPAGARVVKLRAHPGDVVRAGGALAVLATARGAGDTFVLRSPIAGVVVESGTRPLFTITDPARLWVLAELPEPELGKLRIGGLASIESDAYPGRRFAATVENIEETGEGESRRIELRCALPNPGGELKAQMRVRVMLAADPPRDAARVPNSALMSDAGGTYVLLERAPGEFVRRAVSIEFRGADYSYVAQGLSGGERIVTAGQARLTK